MAADLGALILDWRNIDRLGILGPFVNDFGDAQFKFFQTFQPSPSSSNNYDKNTNLEELERILRTVNVNSLAMRCIIHGVFVQYIGSSARLMSPFIHCLEMLFNETNKIRAERHLNICLWILGIYNNLQTMYSEHDISYNQCICECVQYHQNNNNLNISMDINTIKQSCYKNHITPLQILLKNLHPKQRKCKSLNIDSLIYKMFYELNINQSLSTIYLTINDKQSISNDNAEWSCSACTLINDQSASHCTLCNSLSKCFSETIVHCLL